METIQTRKPKNDAQDFDFITIKLASPERVLEWSHGEVTKPETINYRTQRSEKNGLFDEKIFGPDKDFECYCGKYRGIRYKGIVCEKCGVEITRSIVRRERMGHIELSSPVAHIWFLKGIPSRVALITGIPAQDVERVVYFAGYLITNVNEDERKRVVRDLESEFKSKVGSLSDEKAKESLKEMMMTAKREIEGINKGQVLDEVQYHHYSLRYGTMFEAEIGAEAIYKLLQEIDLNELLKKLEAESDAEWKFSRDRNLFSERLSKIFGRKNIVLIINLILCVSLTQLAGEIAASYKMRFFVIPDNPQKVVLRIYGDNLICASFDREAKILYKDISVYKSTDLQIQNMKFEIIGPLKRQEK